MARARYKQAVVSLCGWSWDQGAWVVRSLPDCRLLVLVSSHGGEQRNSELLWFLEGHWYHSRLNLTFSSLVIPLVPPPVPLLHWDRISYDFADTARNRKEDAPFFWEQSGYSSHEVLMTLLWGRSESLLHLPFFKSRQLNHSVCKVSTIWSCVLEFHQLKQNFYLMCQVMVAKGHLDKLEHLLFSRLREQRSTNSPKSCSMSLAKDGHLPCMFLSSHQPFCCRNEGVQSQARHRTGAGLSRASFGIGTSSWTILYSGPMLLLPFFCTGMCENWISAHL